MEKSIFFESISSNLQSEFDSEKIFHMISSSFQIILLMLIFIWMLRRISFLKDQNKTNFIKIIDKLAIGPKESIVIVEIKNEKLVLGVTSNNITHLHTLSSFYKNDKKEDKVDRNTFLKTNFFYYYLEKFSKISWKKTMFYRIILILFFLLFCSSAQAEIPAFTSHVLEDGGQTWSVPIQTLVFLTSLAFLPAFLLMMTSFTRIIIVFGFLRNALGTPYAPPNQILIGLALFLTFFIMSPIFDKVYQEAYIPLSQKKITMEEAIEKGSIPLKQFMLNQTRIPDLELFSKLAHISEYKNKNEIPMRIVLPSFVTSELKTAFQIGFTIFIPFLIIDLVVASVLMALGMIMVPPSTISLPFKLMLFVLSDGWRLLIASLTQSFNL